MDIGIIFIVLSSILFTIVSVGIRAILFVFFEKDLVLDLNNTIVSPKKALVFSSFIFFSFICFNFALKYLYTDIFQVSDEDFYIKHLFVATWFAGQGLIFSTINSLVFKDD